MTTVRISGLTPVPSSLATDYFPIVQGGITYRETLSQVQTLFGYVSNILQIPYGGTGVASVTSSPTVSAWAGWDANKNLSANNYIDAYVTTATAAGTTTLTVSSAFQQFFTGSTTQTVLMPVTSTLVLGQQYLIVNNSSGSVTVQSSGSNTIQVMAANTVLLLTCILTSGTTAASWYANYNYQSLPLTLPLSLANGGTNASLTASNGGIFYSTGSAGAILSGTSTANQALLSGSSAAPAWSTATYPATTTINQLLYSSSANTIAGLSTANNGVLITSGGAVPSISSTLPTAVQGNITQLGAQSQALNMNSHLINNVTDPVSVQDAVTLNYLNNNTMFPNGTVNVTGTTQTITPGTIYYANNSSQVVFTLPSSFTTAQNQSFAVIGRGVGGWKINCSSGTQMLVGSRTCTTTTGFFQSNQQNQIVVFYPAVTNSLYQAIAVIGNISNDLSQTANALDIAFSNNQLVYASGVGTLSGLASATNGTLVTGNSGTPSILAGPGTSGNILQSNSASAPSWSTPTYPSASGTSGKFLISDGTNNVYSTSTIPTSSGGTANKVLLSDGTNYVLSTPTFPNASATSGKIIASDGTNWIASTPTFPNASATSGKIIISDGTNWIASTPTYPSTAGSSGNILTSNGTNWASSAPASFTASGSLNISQITGMYATPVQLVAAPGSNLGILVISTYLNYIYDGSHTITNGGAIVIQYGNTIQGGGTSATNSGTVSTSALIAGVTANRAVMSVGSNTTTPFATSGLTNTGIFISNQTGAFTANSSTATANYTVHYLIVSMS